MQRFTLQRTSRIDILDALLMEYRHEKTGMPVLILQNEDPNRAMVLQFRTPPQSDNGICHILEHSVLSGSRKYDIKEPFVELLKGSLNTFLNAMTMPDRTVYPFSTTNETEFYQLCDVYLDGVFFPNIHHDERILGQEGWHYELTEEGELYISGVVYNEMQGALAQPDQKMFGALQAALYDNSYRFESGGKPEAIPELTQEEFVDYHKRHYHPSNGAVFVYGDLKPEDVLNKLAEYLDAFEVAPNQVDLQKTAAFDAPKKVEIPYSVIQKEKNQSMFGIGYVQGDRQNLLDNLGLKLLSRILFSMESSPVKSMLLEAGLVHDVFAIFDETFLQPMMVVGCRGLEADEAEIVNDAIQFELERLADEGIDPEHITAGINQWKFAQREGFQEGASSKGIGFGIEALANIDRGVDPVEKLDYERLTKEIEERAKEGYFEELIRKYFLENQHRAELLLWPDPNLAAKEEEALFAKLDEIRSQLSDEDIEKILDFQDSLYERQMTPDAPEKLAKLPRLSVTDLGDEMESIELSSGDAAYPSYRVKNLNKGISYVTLMLALDPPRVEELSQVGLLAPLLGALATEEKSYQKLNSDISQYTGGLNISPRIMQKGEDNKLYLQIQVNYLDEYHDEALDLLFEVLEKTQFDNTERIQNIFRQLQSGMESFFVNRGDRVAGDMLIAQFNTLDYYAQRINGPAIYQELKGLAKDVSLLEDFIPKMKKLYESLLAKDRITVFYQSENAEAIEKTISEKIANWPEKGEITALKNTETKEESLSVVVPSSIAFAAKGCKFQRGREDYRGEMLVAKQIIDTDYLWENVRVLGGAYGVGLTLDPEGFMICTSYRDPQPANSLNVFVDIPQYLKNLDLTKEELDTYIIGTYGAINQPLTNDMAMGYAITEVLGDFTEADRLRVQKEVQATTVESIAVLAEDFSCIEKTHHEVVLGSKRLVETLPEEFTKLPLF